ncbi:MAG: hypothetical protein WC192_05620 [Candidatus Babeliales bacterium]|jgi:hypothetical protein
MKFNFRTNWKKTIAIAFFITNTFILQSAIDPDKTIKDELAKLNVAGSAIDTATTAQLTEIENVINAAYTFFSADTTGTPAYTDGLNLIGAVTSPAAGTLRKKIADRKTTLAGGTKSAAEVAFAKALQAATTPAALNKIVNTTTYTLTSIPKLIDYKTTTGSIYSKILGFFTNYVPKATITGTNLTALQTLLINPNLARFLSTAEKTTVRALAISTTLNIANKTTAIAARCAALGKVVDKYKAITVPAAVSNYLFNIAMTPIYVTITKYPSPLTAARKTERAACVAFFTKAGGSKLLTAKQKTSTTAAIKILNAKK